jgi:hypothetical protein
MNKYDAEELFLQSLPDESEGDQDVPRPALTPRPPGTELELKDEDDETVVKPLRSSDVSHEQFNFSNEFQDAILAGYIAQPGRFERFGEVIKPEYFTGLDAMEVVFRLRDYREKYGRAPNFSELGNFAFGKTKRKNPERAAQLMDYVMRLSRVILDEPGIEFLSERASAFVHERAIFDALRKIHNAQQEGKEATVDPVAIMQAAVRAGRDLTAEPHIEDCDALLAEKLEAPPELIRGVLHRDTKLVLGGASKSFKSWSLLDMAASIALGMPWWGLPTTQGRVLYVNFEIPRWAFRLRLQSLCEAKQAKSFNGNLKTICLRGKADDAEKMLARVEREIGRDKYDLIILDPIYKMLGDGDENKAGDIAKILNRVEALLVKTSAAVAFGAHYSKGNQAGKEAQDRIGGSGVFARDPDTLLNMTRHEEEDCFSVDVTTRNLPPVESFVVRWQYPVMVVDNDLNPAKLKKANFSTEYDAKELAVLLAERPLTSTEWKTRALEEIGMSEKTFYRLKKTLKNVTCEDGKFRVAESLSRETLANNAND